MNKEIEDTKIHTDYIQLDQFLKWAGVIGTGGQVKYFIDQGLVTVNGLKIKEKRKKLYPGDIVNVEDAGIWRICREE